MSDSQNDDYYDDDVQVRQNPIKSNASDNEDDSNHIVKLRGLPWNASIDDIAEFLENCEILNGNKGIHIMMSGDNRPSGEAYIELMSSADVNKALALDRNHMGNRYIEVFQPTYSQFLFETRKQTNGMQTACVKLRGLPYSCTNSDIMAFFKGLEIIPNGITFVTDGMGRPNGEAYVQFVSMENAHQAFKKDREKIGHRYIEIFRGTSEDVRRVLDQHNIGQYYGNFERKSMDRMMGPSMNRRPGPYDRQSDRGNRIQNNDRGSFGYKNASFSTNIANDYGMSPRMRNNGPGGMGGMGGGDMGMNRFSMDQGRSGGGMNRRPIDMDMPDRMGNMFQSSGGIGRMNNRMGNDGPWDNDDEPWGNNGNSGGFQQTKFFVGMRGLPFKARNSDVYEFFSPVVPVAVRLRTKPNGSPSGEADVQFASQADVLKAMQKDKAEMHHRYIELFLNSLPSPPKRSNFNNGPRDSSPFSF